MIFDAVFATKIFAASVLASVISGTFGMAGGMVLMGIYSALLPVAAAMIMHGVTQFASNGYRWWILRENTYWQGIFPYALGSLSSVLIFWYLSFVPNKGLIYFILGSVPFIAAILPRRMRLDFAKPRAPILAGLAVSGIQLMAGAAGPALDVFFIDTKLKKREIVATKALTQTIAHLSKIVYFTIIIQTVTAAEESEVPLWIYSGSILCTFIGTSIGNQVLERFSEEQFKKYTRRIVLTIGAFYLYRSATIWML